MSSEDGMGWGGANLSPHLHTDECNVVISMLHQCHHKNKFLKYFGECNDIDREMRKCLKKEYENKRNANNARAEKHRQKLVERDSG